MNKVTLYIAEHNITGKRYFGKTKKYFTNGDLQKHYHGSGLYWTRHLKKHGNDVTMNILGIFSLDEVKEIALKFSEENNIVESKEWANLRPENGLEGGSEKGRKHSEETKRKISESHEGVPLSKLHKKNIAIGQIGNKRSEETKMKLRVPKSEDHKRKLSDKNKGKKLTDETKQKISESNKGRKLSEETKQKMCKPKSDEHKLNISKGLVGRKLSEKHKLNMSKANKGRKLSEETKKKISVANKDKKWSDEYKLNMSKVKKGKKQPIIKCPHCDKEGGESNMKRWHFDNCKFFPESWFNNE